MKPLHITFLAAGAILAGGLAFEMTQAPAIPGSPAPASIVQNPARSAQTAVTMPPPRVPPPLQAAKSLEAPAATAAKAVKPSPIPKPAPLPVTDAPAPIYAEKAKPAVIPVVTHVVTPVVRIKPVAVAAKASPAKTPPIQWTPTPYEAPQASAASAQAVQKADTPVASPSPEPAPVAAVPLPAPRHVTLRTGMTVAIRLDESLSSERAASGDTFQASLAEPLVVDNLVIAERGARATGRIVESQRGTRLGSPALLELALTSVTTSDGQRVVLSTDPWAREAERADDPIGAIFSRPKPATAPTSTVIRFRLASRVTVTEQLASR
jgi:hypothetical protein